MCRQIRQLAGYLCKYAVVCIDSKLKANITSPIKQVLTRSTKIFIRKRS